MKRLSWELPEFTLPGFKVYDEVNHTVITDQVKIGGTKPDEKTYFIGIVGIGENAKKLLCYATNSLGNYIVVSYNQISAQLLKDIVGLEIYDENVVKTLTGFASNKGIETIPVINTTNNLKG